MKVKYTLFEMLMEPSGDGLARHGVVFDQPDEGFPEAVWVKQKASGRPSLCVLWARPEDWEQWESAVREHPPGDPIPEVLASGYVRVQDGMGTTAGGAEIVFDSV